MDLEMRFSSPYKNKSVHPISSCSFLYMTKCGNLGRIYLYELYPPHVALKYTWFMSMSSLKPLNKHLCAIIYHSQETKKWLNTCKQQPNLKDIRSHLASVLQGPNKIAVLIQTTGLPFPVAKTSQQQIFLKQIKIQHYSRLLIFPLN